MELVKSCNIKYHFSLTKERETERETCHKHADFVKKGSYKIKAYGVVDDK